MLENVSASIQNSSFSTLGGQLPRTPFLGTWQGVSERRLGFLRRNPANKRNTATVNRPSASELSFVTTRCPCVPGSAHSKNPIISAGEQHPLQEPPTLIVQKVFI